MKFHLPPGAQKVSALTFWPGLRRVTALLMTALLLPAAPLDLLAQQAGPGYGQPSYPGSYSGTYAGSYPGAYAGSGYPPQQGGYGQQPYDSQQAPPSYGYPQQGGSYGQQPYASQQQPPSYGYPQQGGSYGQQPYPPQQQQPPSYGQAGYAAQSPYGQNTMQAQPLPPQQLDQLVAPIALYPDPLVAQVLTASTYPEQIAEADRWRAAQGYAPAEQIAAGAAAQNWDASVKALTAFPQVLQQLDRNQRWTTDLGNAYFNQPEDVLNAVQQMRQRAQAAGNLQSNAEQTVSYEQGNIEVAVANPQVVYVPAYNPWVVYGPGLSPYPGYSLLGAIGTFVGAAVQFGLGVAISPFSALPFGWLGWGLSWLTHAVLFHNAFYVSHSSSVIDRGFAYGGRRSFARGFNREPSRYSPGRFNSAYGNGFSRGGQGYSGRPVQQAYNHMQPAFNGHSAFASNSYHAPAQAFGRSNFGSFGGQHFAGGSSSGGFHPFGGGSHTPKGFGGGGHSGGGGHFGGGHSGGGGHGGGHFFGKHH